MIAKVSRKPRRDSRPASSASTSPRHRPTNGRCTNVCRSHTKRRHSTGRRRPCGQRDPRDRRGTRRRRALSHLPGTPLPQYRKEGQHWRRNRVAPHDNTTLLLTIREAVAARAVQTIITLALSFVFTFGSMLVAIQVGERTVNAPYHRNNCSATTPPVFFGQFVFTLLFAIGAVATGPTIAHAGRH